MELHSKRKPNKIWVDKGSEFQNSYFKKWLKEIIQNYMQHTMKENLQLPKDLFEL